MPRYSNDHQLEIDNERKGLKLARRDDGSALYQVSEPEVSSEYLFAQENWIDGHGQDDFEEPSKYFEGQSIDTTQDGRVFLGPLIVEENEDDDTDLDSAPVEFRWFPAASKLLCCTAANIYHLDGGGWDVSQAVAGGTSFAVLGIYCYLGVGSSSKWYYSGDGVSWTQTDLTNAEGQKLLVAPNAAGTADILWSAKQPNELYYTTDGRTAGAGGAALSSAAYIGEASTNITNLFLHNNNLLVGREDELFHYDSDGAQHSMRPDLRQNRSTDNFKYVTSWQTGTYHSEIDGMAEMTSSNTYEPMGPLFDIGDIGKRGDIVGLAADKDWLYVAIDEGTNTIIYKGREMRKRGVLRYQWCPFIFLGTETTANLYHCHHSANDRRLWYGYTNSTAYCKLYDDPTADSGAAYAASGWLRMSYIYPTRRNWDMMFQSVVVETSGCSSTETVTIKYRKDTETSATQITGAITTNGLHTVYFDNPIDCKKIQFEIHLARGSTNTNTPEVHYFQARGIEKPEKVRIHEATYLLGDEPSRTTKTIRDFLRGGRTSTNLIKFADLRYGDTIDDGTYAWCIIEPGFPREVEILHEGGRDPEIGIQIRLREIDYVVS